MTETPSKKVVLRKRAPYTCRFEIAPSKPCAAILTETDGSTCPGCVSRKPGELKPIVSVPVITTVERKAHWPFWP